MPVSRVGRASLVSALTAVALAFATGSARADSTLSLTPSHGDPGSPFTITANFGPSPCAPRQLTVTWFGGPTAHKLGELNSGSSCLASLHTRVPADATAKHGCYLVDARTTPGTSTYVTDVSARFCIDDHPVLFVSPTAASSPKAQQTPAPLLRPSASPRPSATPTAPAVGAKVPTPTTAAPTQTATPDAPKSLAASGRQGGTWPWSALAIGVAIVAAALLARRINLRRGS